MSAALLLIALSPAMAAAESIPPVPPTPTVFTVILENGDALLATCVEPASFDMVRITTPEGKWRYLTSMRIDAVIDESGADRTRYVLERGKRVGTRLPKVVSPPGPGLRVGPRSVTQDFAITETTVLGRIGGGPHALGGHFAFDLGGMRNVGERTAVGGTVFVGSGNEYANAGMRVRVRRWLSRTASVDIAPGIIAFERWIHGGAQPPGFSTQVSWSPSRYLSLTTEVFSLRRREYRYNGNFYPSSIEDVRDTGIMVGARVGQWPGAVTGTLAMLSALFMSSISSTP